MRCFNNHKIILLLYIFRDMSEPFVPRELHGKRLIGYSLGYMGILSAEIFRGVFIFQFYVYTVNLNSILVTIGMAMRLIVAAISAIVFGVLADNKKPGKLGKRRPFLFYLLPVWVLTTILIWLPPWYCPKNNSMYLPTALYLWVILILNAISGMSILSVHASMLPEQSQTHKNREKAASMGTILAIIVSIVALFLPLVVQSLLKDPENAKWWEPAGKVILFYIPLIGVGFAIFGLISVIITFFSVDESFHTIIPNVETRKKSVMETFHHMIVPAKDKNYRKFVLVGFFTNISGMMLGILIFPFLTYTLKFKGTSFFIYIIISVSCKFGWFFVWKKVLKKHALVRGYSICVAASAIAAFLELLFLIEFLIFEFKVVLFVITMGTVLGSIYGFGLFAGPLASALIYEAAAENKEMNTDKAVSEISGAYFGLNSFLLSVAGAVGSLIIGLMLAGPNEEDPIWITLALASMGIFYLMSFLILRKIEINEELLEIKPSISEELASKTLK